MKYALEPYHDNIIFEPWVQHITNIAKMGVALNHRFNWLLFDYPCHWGVVNRGCVVMGIPHPKHPFTAPHPTVYETARATRKKTYGRWIFSRWKINAYKMKGLIVHSIVWENLCGILEVLIEFPKFPKEFLWMEVEISFNVKFWKLYPRGRET